MQKARNDAQHGAKAPHPTDLWELKDITLEVIEKVLKLHFADYACTLVEVSFANLLEDEVLKAYVQYAEKCIAQGDLKTGSTYVRLAFLLGRLKRRFDWWKDREGQIIDDYDLGRTLSNNSRYTQSSPPSDEIVVLDYVNGLVSLKGVVVSAYFAHEITKEDCLWAIDYTTETLRRWQIEENNRFTPIDPRYLVAIPHL